MKVFILPLFMWLTLITAIVFGVVTMMRAKWTYAAPTFFFCVAALLWMINDIYYDWAYTSLIFIAVKMSVIGTCTAIMTVYKEDDMSAKTDAALQKAIEKEFEQEVWRDRIRRQAGLRYGEYGMREEK